MQKRAERKDTFKDYKSANLQNRDFQSFMKSWLDKISSLDSLLSENIEQWVVEATRKLINLSKHFLE